MSPINRCAAITILVLAALHPGGAAAQSSQAAAAAGAVAYAAPANPLHQPLHDKLKGERWLERMQAALQHYRLPRPVTLKLDNCGGSVDAWFAKRTVAVCYEYLQVVIRRIEGGQLPAWLTREEALAGAFVDAILHEFGHALIEYHRIPVLGREEDAADQLSAFMMLNLGGDDAGGLIRGTANVYLGWISFFQSRPARQLGSGANMREARAHPTAAQRLYNLVCIALGAEPKSYAELAKAIDMPEDRSEDCAEEYAGLTRAYRTLVQPHVNKSLEANARREFRFFAGKK